MPDDEKYFDSSDLSKGTDYLDSWWNGPSNFNNPLPPHGQWIRKISLTVYKKGGQKSIQLTAPRSDRGPILKVVFRVKKSTNLTPNFLEARIYNLSPQTQASVIEQTRVQLQAGYEQGNYGLIFDGSITHFIRGKESAVDSYLDIFAADGDEPFVALINKTLPAGITGEQKMREVLKDLDLPEGKVIINNQQKSLRSQSIVTTLREFAFVNSQQLGADFFINDGKWYLIQKNRYLPGEAVVLSPKTGLVGIPEVTPSGIQARCLMNSKLFVGGQVKINTDILSGVPYLPGSSLTVDESGNKTYPTPASEDQKTLDEIRFPVQTLGKQFISPFTSPVGLYKIMLLEHAGDTRGNPWYSDIVCIAIGSDGNVMSVPHDAASRSEGGPLLP